MIAIGSDHGGFDLKKEIMHFLNQNGYQYKDLGTFDGSCPSDYPDYGLAVAKEVASGNCTSGIIICGTGIGISISANKVPGIRAALCTDAYMARMSREHNNANILALGARVVGPGLALDIVEAFIKTSFTGETHPRHKQRVDKIMLIEKTYLK